MKYLLFNCAVIAALIFLFQAPKAPTPPTNTPIAALPQAVPLNPVPEMTPPPLPAPIPVASPPAPPIPSRAQTEALTPSPLAIAAPEETEEARETPPKTSQGTSQERTRHLRQMMAEMEQLYVEKVSQ